MQIFENYINCNIAKNYEFYIWINNLQTIIYPNVHIIVMHYYEICMFRTNLRVMLLFSYLITATVTLSLLLSFWLLKKKNKSTSKFEKILMYVLAGVFFLRFMWRKDSLSDSYMLHSNNFDSEFLNAYSIIVTWFTYASTLILILYPFFEIRGKNVLVKYFVLPMSIISSASFFITI